MAEANRKWSCSQFYSADMSRSPEWNGGIFSWRLSNKPRMLNVGFNTHVYPPTIELWRSSSNSRRNISSALITIFPLHHSLFFFQAKLAGISHHLRFVIIFLHVGSLSQLTWIRCMRIEGRHQITTTVMELSPIWYKASSATFSLPNLYSIL